MAAEALRNRYGDVGFDKAEAIVALGGDGLMLQTLHQVMERQVPVYGMNFGSVGFLMNEFAADGLVERRGSDLDEGLDRLRDALRDLAERPLEELLDTVLARLVPRAGEDDVAVVAVRVYPEDRPRPAEAGPNRLPPGVV